MKVKLPQSVSRFLKPLAVVIGGALAPVAGHAADFDLMGGTFTPEKGDALERIVAQIDEDYGIKTTVESLVDANTKTIKNSDVIRQDRTYNLPEDVANAMMVAKLAQGNAARATYAQKATADIAKIENVQTVAAVKGADLPEGFSAAVLKAAMVPSDTIMQDRLLATLDAAAADAKQKPQPAAYTVLSFGDSVSGTVNGRMPSFDANDFVVLAGNDTTTDAGAALKILSEEKPSETPGMCVVQVEKPCTVTEEEKPATDVVKPKPRPDQKFYIVKPGDGLCQIARSEDKSFDGIVEKNGIKNPNDLSVGQKLDVTGVESLDKNGKLYKDFCTGTGPLPKPVHHAAAAGHSGATPKTAPVAAGAPVSGFKPWGPIKPEQCMVEKTASGKYVFKPLSQKWAECGCPSESYWITLYDENGNAYKKRVQGGSASSNMCKDGGDHVVTRPPEPPKPPVDPGDGGCKGGPEDCGGGEPPCDDTDGPPHEPPHDGGGEPPHEPPHDGGGEPHEPPHDGGGEPPHDGGGEPHEPPHDGGGETPHEPSHDGDGGHSHEPSDGGHKGEEKGEKHAGLPTSAPAPSFA